MPRTKQFLSQEYKKEVGDSMVWDALEKNPKLTAIQLKRIVSNLYTRLNNGDKIYARTKRIIKECI